MPNNDLGCPQCKEGHMDRKEWGRTAVNPEMIDKVICPTCGFQFFIRRTATHVELLDAIFSLNKIGVDLT